MCSSDYEVFHTSGTGSASDSADHYHEDYNQEGADQKQYDLSGFKRISPTPKITLSHSYISPENAERHFTRSVSEAKNGYSDGYSAFIQNDFEKNDDDDDDYVNSKYRQKNDENDDEDVEVNSEYDEDEDEVVNSKYRQAPKDVEENEHNYYNAYHRGDELDRTQSLSQKEEAEPAQSTKDCKIIVKGKAMCRLCKDPASGAHSESCTFSSALPEKKYAYIQKEKYVS